MTLEVVGGILSNSLAIYTDAAHMLADFSGFAISILAIWIGKIKATDKMSYGYHRAEVVGALMSVLIIWVMTGLLVNEGIHRIKENQFDIDVRTMLIISIIGFICNLIMGHILHSHGGHGQSHGGHGNSHGGHGHSHGASEKKKVNHGLSHSDGHIQEKKSKLLFIIEAIKQSMITINEKNNLTENLIENKGKCKEISQDHGNDHGHDHKDTDHSHDHSHDHGHDHGHDHKDHDHGHDHKDHKHDHGDDWNKIDHGHDDNHDDHEYDATIQEEGEIILIVRKC